MRPKPSFPFRSGTRKKIEISKGPHGGPAIKFDPEDFVKIVKGIFGLFKKKKKKK